MIQIDLITGFLGSGKTTFIKKYASWLMRQGLKIGILENDFGPINVDMLLLQELERAGCGLEMISGGCDRETHQRRFKTKLIAMAMSGYDRVLVEPSGIYDTDEFFDTLCEEPLDRWYKPGNVIAILDARLEETLSPEAEYLLASECANAGCVVLSRSQEATPEQQAATLAHLNRALAAVRCSRSFALPAKDAPGDVLCRDWDYLNDADWKCLSACGHRQASFEKLSFAQRNAFSSLFFLNLRLTEPQLRAAAEELLYSPAYGKVFRVKGFLRVNSEKGAKAQPESNVQWIELNATANGIAVSPISAGQDVLIVIGEHLDREKINALFSAP